MKVFKDFSFFSWKIFVQYKYYKIKKRKSAIDLAIKYEKDIKKSEFIDKISDFQHVNINYS
jgi:hypothetical protein